MTSFRPLTQAEMVDIYDMLKMADREAHGNNEPLFTALEAMEEAIVPEPPKPLRGLLAYVYRNGDTDASNGGISSRCQRVIVTGPGVPEIFEASDERPAVEIGKVEYNGETTYHLRPAGEPGTRYMAGGAFVSTSDSRFRKLFPFYGAIPLHDRYEG